MGWHMKLVICVQLAYVFVCLTQEMSVVREWTSLDVQLAPEDGQESRRSILPSDVNYWLMYKDRVFVTLSGQPYSLAYLTLTDNSTSPLLRPYPSYENQLMLYYSDKVRVDRCDRIWVNSIMYGRGKYYNLIVFDLKTDRILRNSSIPDLHYSYDMTVDDFDCDNEYVYISSYDHIWTYSWAEDDSWRHISDPIYSMILAPNSMVYYNVGIEPMVYYMSTTHLRDKCNKTIDIRELGRSRKLNVNLTSSAIDAKSDVLYYFDYNDSKTVIHAVPCWTSERCSLNCQDVSIDPTHELDYITLDENGYLWAFTKRSSIEDGEINFRLLSVPVKSTCVESNVNDTTNTSTDGEPNAKDTTNTTNINEITTPASSTTEQTSTLGSVPKHTTVNIADTTAGTPNSNITQAVGGTNVPHLLFSFANVTFNSHLSNFTVINFPNNYFH